MPAAPKQFPLTRWTFVEFAAQPEHPAQQKALDDLLSQYLPALRAFAAAEFRLDEPHAEDLVQSFVLEKVLKSGLLARADRRRGKFRTFLLNTLTNFVISELRKAGAQKRSPIEGVVSLDELLEDSRDLSASPGAAAFDVLFARQVIQESIKRMEAQCDASGRSDIWGVFQTRLLNPAFEGAEPAGYEELVQRFGFQSPGHASNVLITAKRMFARVIRAVIGEYTANPEEIESELNELLAILSESATPG